MSYPSALDMLADLMNKYGIPYRMTSISTSTRRSVGSSSHKHLRGTHHLRRYPSRNLSKGSTDGWEGCDQL